MTKKDFILIANVLRINRERLRREYHGPRCAGLLQSVVAALVADMAAEFARTCPRFDRQKFIEACQ
jgi:hypothetical protein